MKVRVLSWTLAIGAALGAPHVSADCRHGSNCQSCGPQVIVKLVPAKHLPGFHKHECCWHCASPPRGPILESVAIERVAPPYLRTEVVVSREAFRVVPVVATGPQAAAPQAQQQGAPQQTPAASPQATCPAGTAQGAANPNGAAAASQAKPEGTADQRTIDQRLDALEKHMIELSRIMLDQRRADLERNQAAPVAPEKPSGY